MQKRFDWQSHIKDVEREYGAARLAVRRLIIDAQVDPNILAGVDAKHRDIRELSSKLEGTYLVRLFAAFEAALRSYDRSRRNDSTRETNAAVLINSIGGRRGRRISAADREGAHAVRMVRNYWAHENEEMPTLVTMLEAHRWLQRYVSRLPDEWE